MKNSVRDEKDALELFETSLKQSEDVFSSAHTAWAEDNRFSLGDQWPDEIRNLRETAENARPCLTINKSNPLVMRIVNEAKQQRLGIVVKPVDEDADPETAQIIQALIRNVEYNSNAKNAYMWAYECAVRGGMGFFRIVDEYASHDSFDLVARIRRIKSPLSVYYDPNSEEVDGSDQQVCQLIEVISEKQASRLGIKEGEEISTPSNSDLWRPIEGQVRIGEMYWKEEREDELLQFQDGSKALRSQIDSENWEALADLPNRNIVRSRKTLVPRIRWGRFVDGRVIGNLQDVNCDYIPVVPVFGRRSTIDGKVDLRGIVRDSKDPCRMYNYMSSLMVERIALAPRAPWIAAVGQLDGHESLWKEANVKNLPYLPYNPKSAGGQVLPPPQRADASTGDPTVERYMMIASEDIKATSSMYNESMGREDTGKSGVAIQALQAAGSLSTYDFMDNLGSSVRQCGRLLVNIFPKIMTGPQVIRIVGEDGQDRPVKINEQFLDEKTGEPRIYDITAGHYDVEMDIGTGDQTRREIAVDRLTTILQTNPQAANILMDVLVENLDLKDADKIARRFKALLPPEVIEAESGDLRENPEVDALMKHAETIIEQLKLQQQELVAKLQELELSNNDKSSELEIKREELELKKQELQFKHEEALAKIAASGEDSQHTTAVIERIDSLFRPLVEQVGENEGDIRALSEQIGLVIQTLEGIAQKVPASENASGGNGTEDALPEDQAIDPSLETTQ